MIKNREEIKNLIRNHTDKPANQICDELIFGIIDSNQHWLESDIQCMIDEINGVVS